MRDTTLKKSFVRAKDEKIEVFFPPILLDLPVDDLDHTKLFLISVQVLDTKRY